MQASDYDIKILNGLTATTIDSVNGYREAATEADSEHYRSMFTECADEREEVVDQLQSMVRSMGGEPVDSGTTLGGAHRMFLNLRDAVTGGDDEAIIAEVENGEDHIKEKFENAMADPDVSPNTIQMIRECYASIKDGHDRMRDLKHGISGMKA